MTTDSTAGVRLARPGRVVMTALIRGALTGAALGLGWGLTARIWMRAISTEPEFSWAGTLIILGLAAWLGLGARLLAVARATGQRPWWALLGAPGLLLFAGPGLLFFPSFAIGGLALSDRALIWRFVGLLAIAAPVLAVWQFTTEDPHSDDGIVLFAVTGFAMLSAGLAVIGSAFWTRSAAPPRLVWNTVKPAGCSCRSSNAATWWTDRMTATASSTLACSKSSVCRLGMTSVWPSVAGTMSRNARLLSSSHTAAGAPATIAQAAGGPRCRLHGLGRGEGPAVHPRQDSTGRTIRGGHDLGGGAVGLTVTNALAVRKEKLPA